jgi:hypothetical protein
MSIIKFIYAVLLILFAFSIAEARQNSRILKVKYISVDYIYLDGGAADGIFTGDTIQIVKDGISIALLKAVFVAENSTSCEILSKEAEINIGDKVIIYAHITVDTDTTKIRTLSRQREFNASSSKTKMIKTRISGFISAQWYQFMDANNGLYDFKQPAFRLNLNGRNLWNDSYYLRIRARSRYNERARRFNDNVPQSEWRNRIYELSFSYENLFSAFNYKVGRIISNKFSGVGYIDGVQLQHNISGNLNWGIFGGTQPEWHYSGFQTSYQKYGGFVNYIYGDYSAERFESTLALAGIYHTHSISREVIFLQNSYNHSRKWNFYQSMELDVNRNWRKQKTGENISLSGLYLNGRYYINDDLNIGLSYDNRKNYYSYELRSLADSLFDDAFRQGVRLFFNYSLYKNLRFYGNGGLLKRENTALTYSYGGGLNAGNLFNKRVIASARFSGFSNLYTKGLNPSTDISWYFSKGHYLMAGYGNYCYRVKSNNSTRFNQYLRFNGQLELPLDLFLAGDYEYSFGDDSEGNRILFDLGYRF